MLVYKKITKFAANKYKPSHMIKLSIIVPVYNVEKYIRPCFESIFKQGLDENDYEVIIVNDGSTDNSMQMIEGIIAQHNNITIINQENKGLSVARNNGIAVAKGEYILMPDSDDLLIDNSLKPLLEKAIEYKAELVVADFLKMNDEEIDRINACPPQQQEIKEIEMTGEQLYINEIIPNEFYVWRTLFKKDFIRQINKFIPGIYFQDIPFTHESYLKAKRCIRTNRILYIYRRWNQSVSAPSSFKIKNAKDFCIAIAKSWEIRNIKGLSPAVLKKHMDYEFVSFQNLLYRTLFAIEGTDKKVKVLKLLKKMAPDMRFNNGIKQSITSIFYRKMPKLYIRMLLFQKKFVWGK